MRVLVTGASGFVGRHLVAALLERGHAVVGADRESEAVRVDVTERASVRDVVASTRPDAIAHLAAQASIPDSFKDPERTFATNAGGTLNLLESVRACAGAGVSPRILVVSSGDVYGTHPAEQYPLREEAALFSGTPYAASKIAAEALGLAYAHSFGLDVVVTRAFNAIGAGQDERFAVSAWAAQLARVAAGGTPVVRVGNLDAQRDFLDVRDVAAAYVALLEGGGSPGETYNVASGVATSLREVLRRLIAIAAIPVQVRDDPERMRPSDVPLSVGDPAKLRAATGWEPRIPIGEALRAAYEDARARAGVPS